MVALEAAGDNIIPGLASPFDDRDDMIKCQVFRGALCAAILASVQIPGVDIGPAELDVLEALSHPDVFQETEHARHLDREAYAADFTVVLGQYLHLALEEQGDGPLPGDDVEGLIAGIENECMFHQSFPAVKSWLGANGSTGREYVESNQSQVEWQ